MACKARRTLTVDGLSQTVSVKPGHYELDEWDLPDRTTLLDVYTSLNIIGENSNTIRPAHYTVQEYLLKNCIIPSDADSQLAIVCTTFLSIDITANPQESQLQPHPFLECAVAHLPLHLSAYDENLTTDILVRLLRQPRGYQRYLEILEHLELLYLPPCLLPLHGAITLRHCLAACQILEKDVDTVKIPDREGRTTLHKAALWGQENVV